MRACCNETQRNGHPKMRGIVVLAAARARERKKNRQLQKTNGLLPSTTAAAYFRPNTPEGNACACVRQRRREAAMTRRHADTPLDPRRSSAATLVRLAGAPMVDDIRDCASEERAGSTCEHFPTARIVEAAARQLSKAFEIQRRKRAATQARASNVPKAARDPSPAVRWKHVHDVDLDAARTARTAMLPRWPASDESDHALRDRRDHSEPVWRLH